MLYVPDEVWAIIIHHATFTSFRVSHEPEEIPPFESLHALEEEGEYSRSLVSKRNLSLVSSKWHALVNPFLYEDVTLKQGSKTLADTLETSQSECERGEGLGRYVRRLRLPPMYDKERHRWRKEVYTDAKRVIACCPNLEVISTKGISDKETDMHSAADDNHPFNLLEDVSLPPIKRIDWDSLAQIGESRRPVSMPISIWTSPTIKTISLRGDNLPWDFHTFENLLNVPSSFNIPHAETIRVGSLVAFGLPVMNYKMVLPALRRVVLEKAGATHALIAHCLSHCGKQVRSLEIGCDKRFRQSDYLGTLLMFCPAIEELYYPLFWMRPFADEQRIQNRKQGELLRVGLHSIPHDEDGQRDLEISNDNWIHMKKHFDGFLSSESPFTRLAEIRLFGKEWHEYAKDDRFTTIIANASARKVNIRGDDPLTDSLLTGIISEGEV